MPNFNEEHEPIYFVWERDRRAVRCAKYRGIPHAKAEFIVSKRILTLAEEAIPLPELAAKYPYKP